MKRIFIPIVLIIVFSCKDKPIENSASVDKKITVSVATGKQIFESNNCMACHQLSTKSVGPSVADIAKIYKEKKGNMIAFLKAQGPAIVDPSQYASMQVNLEITKNMSDEELESLEKYILSINK
jgi:cytochrome c